MTWRPSLSAMPSRAAVALAFYSAVATGLPATVLARAIAS